MAFQSNKSKVNKKKTTLKIFRTPRRKSKKVDTFCYIITCKTASYWTILGLARKGTYANSGGAFDSAKNHKRQRRKRQSVTAKREKSQTPKFV